MIKNSVLQSSQMPFCFVLEQHLLSVRRQILHMGLYDASMEVLRLAPAASALLQH